MSEGFERRSTRHSLIEVLFFTLALLFIALLAYSAINGEFGALSRLDLQAEREQLVAEKTALEHELAALKNLTHRLSDDYMDLDYLDERVREVLGYMRSDERLIRGAPSP